MNSNTTPAQDTLVLVGRALMAWLFIPSGWGKLVGFSGVVGYISSKGIPFPEVAAAIAVFAELGLGILVLIGWQARWAALGLAGFLAVITPIFHNFWISAAAQSQAQSFWKNIAVLGGMLVLAAFGPGRLSVDGRVRGEVVHGKPAYGNAR